MENSNFRTCSAVRSQLQACSQACATRITGIETCCGVHTSSSSLPIVRKPLLQTNIAQKIIIKHNYCNTSEIALVGPSGLMGMKLSTCFQEAAHGRHGRKWERGPLQGSRPPANTSRSADPAAGDGGLPLTLHPHPINLSVGLGSAC